jgi:FlaA1/EpsC-like NDP-sugar epimerase
MNYRILKNFAPRWIIFCIDLILISTAFAISYFLIDQDTIELKDFFLLFPALLLNFAVSLVCIMIFAIYKGIIRYSEVMDIIRVMKFALLQFALWSIIYFSGALPLITGEFHLPPYL